MEYFKQISVLSFSPFHFLCLSSSSLLSLITSPNNFGKKVLNSCRIYTYIMGWIYCPPNRAKLVSLKLYHTFINVFSYLDVILMVKATIRACKKFFYVRMRCWHRLRLRSVIYFFSIFLRSRVLRECHALCERSVSHARKIHTN